MNLYIYFMKFAVCFVIFQQGAIHYSTLWTHFIACFTLGPSAFVFYFRTVPVLMCGSINPLPLNLFSKI